MKNLKLSILAALLVSVFTGLTLAQPATTAKTFRMYLDATHTVSITATGATAGTGTFTWPQPSAGIFKSDATGIMSIGPVGLNTSDVTGVLNVSNGGTGTTTFGPAGSIAYSTAPGGPLGFSASGTTGQFLISGGSGAPTWSTTVPSGSVPFNVITNGTNTGNNGLLVGNGSVLAPTGTGVITANQFIGSGSTTNAVDLATAEVAGILPPGNGGTGTNTVGPVNSVAYSNGTTLAYTAAPPPAVNSLLVSIGGAAPTYTNSFPSGVGVPFSNITSGTNNTAAMLVGSGSTLFPTGTGQIGANVFVGTGSTSNAVDLNTAEVNGILPVGNGGTGVNTAGAAGSIFYSSGPLGSAPLSSTGAGTTGQVLTVNGSGNPAWSSLGGQLIAKGRVAGDNVNFSYTITPGGTIPATATIIATLESGVNQAITVTARTGTTFTVQIPNVLSTSEFINYLIF